MVIASLAIFILLVFAITMRVGRVAGLALTALCGAVMAFFMMPPVFSFRVLRTSDVLALAFYATTGLVLTHTAPSRRRRALPDTQWAPAPKRLEADLATAVADLDASALGERLRKVAGAIAIEGCALPCTADETFRILSDTVTAALAVQSVQRISIFGSQQPSARRLKVVAHRVWPTPENEIIMIGRREENCIPADFPGWPAHAHASWFDNGYDCIYQVSVDDSRRPDSPC
ncbi:MAG TPA: DUF4118 domain-containing protein [Bryobacteraceae bacterium]|jgi:hypothetical protein|nr:DUF4118 domain-containing protein [Bryobacteraceae bacterium]